MYGLQNHIGLSSGLGFTPEAVSIYAAISQNRQWRQIVFLSGGHTISSYNHLLALDVYGMAVSIAWVLETDSISKPASNMRLPLIPSQLASP